MAWPICWLNGESGSTPLCLSCLCLNSGHHKDDTYTLIRLPICVPWLRCLFAWPCSNPCPTTQLCCAAPRRDCLAVGQGGSQAWLCITRSFICASYGVCHRWTGVELCTMGWWTLWYRGLAHLWCLSLLYRYIWVKQLQNPILTSSFSPSGYSTQVAVKSWWPLYTTWHESDCGVNLGYWTELNEEWYQKVSKTSKMERQHPSPQTSGAIDWKAWGKVAPLRQMSKNSHWDT